MATTTLFSCLGQIHVLCGEFAKAGRVFARAVKSFPDDAAMIQQHAQMRLIETAVKDSAEEAVAVYESLAGKTLADAQTMAGCRKAFLILGAYGEHGAAIRLGQYLLARDPDDLIVEHHLDALTERARDRASPAYLVACFDRHAATFDEHLVEGLKYDVPAKAHALLCEEKARASNILDIGCGTGLAAPYLLPLGRSITGVDVSAGMLAEARKRNLYDSLVEKEAVAFLEETDENFDLVVALDVLPYTGALEDFFAAVAARLSAGGLFAISHETSHCATYEFLPSGRFAHSLDYIQRLCGDAFALTRVFPTTLRLEAGRAVEGNIALLRRVES